MPYNFFILIILSERNQASSTESQTSMTPERWSEGTLSAGDGAGYPVWSLKKGAPTAPEIVHLYIIMV